LVQKIQHQRHITKHANKNPSELHTEPTIAGVCQMMTTNCALHKVTQTVEAFEKCTKNPLILI
jgi:hypothetical protein